ncbi:probable iron/ascorbate oxidoreductase DDB_G0283291 [Folsomia candida]|uniref:probable iron/ascorbate oxidoreductase DDB_G0283291 n=1 Tax=Folsomia candida TaxID=158441 RepID=UPI000B8F5405|nr:probable iron/ascorbate oxidoreductase DDB_G0283291 [Folsomia candida]
MEGQVPIVSVKTLLTGQATDPAVLETSKQLLTAAHEWGFIFIKDHGVPHEFLEELDKISRDFFALPMTAKMELKMLLGGKAWRGYFPPGGEQTSGIPDAKEGIYFGTELGPDHPRVKAGTPLHGKNLWPDHTVPKLRPIILEYLARLTILGHELMRGFAIGLELGEDYFKKSFGKNGPTILFRIFNYPKSDQVDGWGVGEHTDYGFLTILKTDHHPGLQVLSPDQTWIDVPPIKDTFIVNLGDQLEIATQGFLRATPHRVKIQRSGDRLSWPFFFDPDWDVKMRAVAVDESRVLKEWIRNGGSKNRKPGQRWDGMDLHQNPESVTYGEYLMNKVSKCFPELFSSVL